MNHEFEAHIKHNAKNPDAVKDLKALLRQFNSLRDLGRIKELPLVENPTQKKEQVKVTPVPKDLDLLSLEYNLRLALRNLNHPEVLLNSELLMVPEVRKKIPDIDLLYEEIKSEIFRKLLICAIETLKVDDKNFTDKMASDYQNSYEVLRRTAIMGATNEQAASGLFISRMTFYRRKQIGINRIMEFLLSDQEAI